MTEHTNKDQNVQMQQPDDEINLLELLLVIVQHKKMIILTCVTTFIVACGLTLLMPNIYTATARILPSQEDSGGLSSMLGSMGGLASLAGISSGGGKGELYVGMLKSRTVSDAIIERFDLMKHYEWNSRSGAYSAMAGMAKFSLGKDDGILSVSFEDEDPALAADIANAYVEELQKLNVKINLNNAGRERLFLEDRLKLVKRDLANAEDALKEFQEKNKAIRIDDQASAIIGAIASLKGELASKEVELGVLLSSQTEQNPQVVALREGIIQIKEQISKMERSPQGNEVSGDIFLATSEVPELGIQYARLLRDFKVQETLFELLTKQYEVAKISEAKSTSTIQILDNATPPDGKSKPKRAMIVILATFCAGFVSLIVAFVRGFGSKLEGEDRQLWEQIKVQMWMKKKV